MPPIIPSLETLPQPVQQRIVALALADDPSLTLIALTALGRSLHDATRSVLARTLTLDDDDAVLVAAEEWAEQRREGRGPSQDEGGQALVSGAGKLKGSVLAQVVARDDWANKVIELVVVRPALDRATLPAASSAHQFEQFSFDEDSASSSLGDADSTIPPLNDVALFGLLRRCKNLTSFTWSSYRLPPDDLCQVLGESAKGLLHFKVDLVAGSLAGGAGPGEEAAGVGAGSFVGSPSSPQLGTSPTAAFGSHGTGSTSRTPPRWDATSLSSVTSTLTSLSISSLSLAGSRALSTSLPSFPSLESLCLSRTLFVDDAVLSSIGENCKALKRLEVREMGGTKVGENGLGEVFAGCESLEVLVLDAVEGRFSRSTWSNLAPLPSSLHTLTLRYPESGPHKSWVLDHLFSLSSILTPTGGPGLKRLTVSRKVRLEALVPGSHHLATNPIDPALDPSKWVLTASSPEIEAICEDGKRWECLEMDLWTMDGGAVKRVLEECAGVRKVKVLLDAPFRNLLSLGSSFAASSALRWFVASIPPHHTPELCSLDPNEYLALVGSFPSPSSPAKCPSGEKGDKEDRSTHPVSHLSSLTPPTREWRRFLKRSHTLESLTWGGRGGLGTWRFGSKAGSSLLRVEFEPTRPSSASTAGSGAVEVPKSPRSPMGRRRSSILSFGTTPSPTSAFSTLSLSPPSPSQTAQTTPQTSPYTSFGSVSREVCSPPTGSGRRRSSTSSTASSAFFATPSHTTGSGSALGLYPIPSPPSSAIGSPSKKSFADAPSGPNGPNGAWTVSAGGGVTAGPGWAENGSSTAATSIPPVDEEQGTQAEANAKTAGGGRGKRVSSTTSRKKFDGAANGGGRK